MPNKWKVVTRGGTIMLGPALLQDPAGILNQDGCPTIQDIDTVTWKINPGNFSRGPTPWRPSQGRLSELEGLFRGEDGVAWKILLRGHRTFDVAEAYPVLRAIKP